MFKFFMGWIFRDAVMLWVCTRPGQRKGIALVRSQDWYSRVRSVSLN